MPARGHPLGPLLPESGSLRPDGRSRAGLGRPPARYSSTALALSERSGALRSVNGAVGLRQHKGKCQYLFEGIFRRANV